MKVISAVFKVLIALAAIAAIVWGVRRYGERQATRPRRFEDGTGAYVTRVEGGVFSADGDTSEWGGIPKFSLTEPDDPESTERDWVSVGLAYDRENLYMLVNLPYVLKERSPRGRGTSILGQVHIELDGDPNTGASMELGDLKTGVDRRITILVRRADADSPLCPGYYVESCTANGECEKMRCR